MTKLAEELKGQYRVVMSGESDIRMLPDGSFEQTITRYDAESGSTTKEVKNLGNDWP
jgi:hypothetical protein